MALGTPQGVTFSKAARYYIPITYNNNDKEEAKEAKMEKKQKKLEALSEKAKWAQTKLKTLTHGLKMTDDNDIWDSWNWNRIEKKTKYSEDSWKGNSKLADLNIWEVNQCTKTLQSLFQLSSHDCLCSPLKSQLIAVKQTCNWLSRRMTLEEMVIGWW